MNHAFPTQRLRQLGYVSILEECQRLERSSLEVNRRIRNRTVVWELGGRKAFGYPIARHGAERQAWRTNARLDWKCCLSL